MNIISAFTQKYDSLQNRLLGSAVIKANTYSFPAVVQWDTGASGSCISRDVVRTLNLQPTGMVKVHTPSGIGTMKKYIVDLVLNREVVIKNLVAMDSEIGAQQIDVLIGMDVIQLGDFAVSNFQDKTQFTFRIPSQEHIEFKKQ